MANQIFSRLQFTQVRIVHGVLLGMGHLVAAGLLLAQGSQSSSSGSYTFDVNGRRTESSRTDASRGGGGNSQEESVLNLNGGRSPLERVEERVISDNGTTKVVERLVRPFNADGRPGQPTKIRVEETKESDGTVRSSTSVYDANVNGGFALRETVSEVSRKVGNATVTETEVARPTLNGRPAVVERKQTTTTPVSDTQSKEESVTMRVDANGRFVPAVRQVKETAVAGATTKENTAVYITGENGRMQLGGQTVTETTKRPDGSEFKAINIFGIAAQGRPSSGGPQLREQQLIETRQENGQQVETLSIRRPKLQDGGALGPATKISERVCQGNCAPAAKP